LLSILVFVSQRFCWWRGCDIRWRP